MAKRPEMEPGASARTLTEMKAVEVAFQNVEVVVQDRVPYDEVLVSRVAVLVQVVEVDFALAVPSLLIVRLRFQSCVNLE